MPIPLPIIEGMKSAPHLYQMTTEQVKEVFRQQAAAQPPLPYAGRIEQASFPTAGRDTPVRIYSMPDMDMSPVIMFLHGGGMVFGDLNILDGACRYLSEHVPCTVISVDYALAPESKFPGPLEECYETIRWVSQHAEALHIDRNRIAVAGDSAGGNLSAAVSILARERKEFTIVHQVLLYAWLDLTADYNEKVNETNNIPLDAGDLDWCRNHYLNDPSEASLPLVSPLFVEDPSGLPTATFITEGHDPLLQEDIAYAERLKAAGVTVTRKHFDEMIHAFIQFTGMAEEASEALDFVCEQLRKSFLG